MSGACSLISNMAAGPMGRKQASEPDKGSLCSASGIFVLLSTPLPIADRKHVTPPKNKMTSRPYFVPLYKWVAEQLRAVR